MPGSLCKPGVPGTGGARAGPGPDSGPRSRVKLSGPCQNGPRLLPTSSQEAEVGPCSRTLNVIIDLKAVTGPGGPPGLRLGESVRVARRWPPSQRLAVLSLSLKDYATGLQ